MKKNNIILIGFMAVGKTTVGKILATKENMEFIDTDQRIVEKVGYSIQEIFANKGEPYFRSLEEETIHGLMGIDNAVIATGGGVVMNPLNRERLQQLGWVIHLEASKGWILQNLKRSEEERPLLQEERVEEKIENLLLARKDFYAMADYRVKVDHKTPDEIAKEIMQLIFF